ncbi:MAG: GNAT family N-acetyltransferase [Bacteroidetes bacterium GWF2_33_16]|nr:MAG: GNAT family N-acetyltransferase [Bacteroidetes bacterium GWE2_32_14]OFY08696.1 MAG: GNAT family N-acetyltransferase [Bacteroidetes bacterium GWF2_33_16]
MNILEGNITRLRPVEPKDAELIYFWENDSSVWQMSNTIVPFSKFVIEQFIETAQQDIFQSKQLRLMIDKTDVNSIDTIGTIDIFEFDPLHMRAGIGILIAKETDREKGFASDALNTLIHYCFNTLLLHQVYCNICSDNTSSINLFTRKGFELIGIKKDWVRTNDGWKDELMLQLINQKWGEI